MTSIASKNLYELLGNDPELDPDRAPDPPTKAIDKPVQRAGKRNTGTEPPAPRTNDRPRAGGRGQNFTGSEQAYRDQGAGSYQNRSRGTDERVRGESGRGRGGRGGRGFGGGRGPRPPRDDRHSRTGIAEHEKQTGHGWGAATGEGEWADEKAGEALARAEGTDAAAPAAEDGADGAAATEEAEPEQPEDKTKSYDDWLAEQAEKKLQLGDLALRKPNEGDSKKFPEGKALARADEQEEFFSGSGGKAKRERQRKEKAFVELDDARVVQQPRESFRGGRGGRGRGEGNFRGEGRGRGGGRGRGEHGGRGEHHRGEHHHRGGPRGGRGSHLPNVTDEKAFPSLGA